MLNFSFALIMRNESKTIPRLIASLKEFQERGGVIVVLDTGSTDGSQEIARDLGCEVYEVGEKFLRTIDAKTAAKINQRFLVSNEKSVVQGGDRQFDYAAARNYIADHAPTDFIFTPDCDEIWTKFDIDTVQQSIASGIEQLEYNFVFSHDQFGKELLKFKHSKAYNRKKMRWVGIIHEVLQGSSKVQVFGEDVLKLEHFQNVETQRGHYLRGLALDCFENPDNDRNSHYFGRELMYQGRYKSAIQELKRHIGMQKWHAERAQSMIFVGDCYGYLVHSGISDKQKKEYTRHQYDYYNYAFSTDSSRNEALIKLARFSENHKNWQAAACYAMGATQIPFNGYYGNDMSHYTNIPHEILYRAMGWLGRIPEAQKHINICLTYQPLNGMYLRDLRYYYNLPDVTFIIPHIEGTRQEGLDRVINSINALNYPQDKIKIHVVPGDEETVPQKVNQAANILEEQWLVYAADDVEFTANSLILSVMTGLQGFDLVAFNTGDLLPDAGNACEHFLINKFAKAVFMEGDEVQIFSEDFHHAGCDNWLWENVEKKIRLNDAVVHHYHFSKPDGIMDEVYDKGWSKVEQDRETLAKKRKFKHMKENGGPVGENLTVSLQE